MKRIIVLAAVVLTVGVTVAARSSGQAPAAQAHRTPDTYWQAERAQQLRLVMDRARAIAKDMQLKVQIGTMRSNDLTASETALADLEALVGADATRASRPARTVDQIASLRQQVAEALRNLDVSEIKFDNGMITTSDMNQAIAAVVRLLTN